MILEDPQTSPGGCHPYLLVLGYLCTNQKLKQEAHDGKAIFLCPKLFFDAATPAEENMIRINGIYWLHKAIQWNTLLLFTVTYC